MSVNPPAGVKTFTYDSRGGLSQGDPACVITYQALGKSVPLGDGLAPDQAPLRERAAPPPLLSRTVEFRLTGPEAQEQTVPFPGPASGADTLVVTTNNLRAYFTRNGVAEAPGSAIGALEVRAEVRHGVVVCCAQLTDFGAEDLVVVRIDVTVFTLGR